MDTVTASLTTLLYRAIPLQLFLIVRRVYGQTLALTLVKFVALALLYCLLLVLTFTVAVIRNLVSL